jgi:biotin carboxylase
MMTGREGSIESLVLDGRVVVLGFCDKIKSGPPFSYDLRLVYPGDYGSEAVRDILALNEAVIAALGVRTGFTHLEFIVTPKGMRLIEIAARGCGARVVTDLLPAVLGVDLVTLRVRQALGENIGLTRFEGGRYGVLRFIELPPGRIVNIGDVSVATSVPGVVALHFPKVVGDLLSPPENADGRPGFVITVGKQREEALAAAEHAIRMLGVQISPIVGP